MAGCTVYTFRLPKSPPSSHALPHALCAVFCTSDIRISKMFYLHLYLVTLTLTFSLFSHFIGNIHLLFSELSEKPGARSSI